MRRVEARSAAGGAPASVELALERLHDARLTGDRSLVDEAERGLDEARQNYLAERNDLVQDLNLEERKRALSRRANSSLFERIMRGDALWEEVREDFDRRIQQGPAAVGVPRDVFDDLVAHPDRIRFAVYSAVSRSDYRKVVAANLGRELINARAHDAEEARNLTRFLLERGYIPPAGS